MEKSKTQQALEILRNNPGMTQYRVCQLLGVSQSLISRALSAERMRGHPAKPANRYTGYFEPRVTNRAPAVSRTRIALDLLSKDPEMGIENVARSLRIGSNAIYAARKRLKRTESKRCKHCGSFLRYLEGVIDTD
jgi:predicted transcriptional regulator